MKKLSNKEFEEKVQELIDKKITRKELATQLETSMRTLTKKITELSKTNPNLYTEFITVYPYKPKSINVDIENLAVQVIKNGIDNISKETGISSRTITRKVKTLKDTNPELYDLYKRRNENMSEDEKARYIHEVNKLDKMQKVERSELKDKEVELTSILSEFEKKVASGMSKNKAAIALGFDGYPTIWKKYQELDRIKTQNMSLKSEEKKSFREELQSKYKTGKDYIQGKEKNKNLSKEKDSNPKNEELSI